MGSGFAIVAAALAPYLAEIVAAPERLVDSLPRTIQWVSLLTAVLLAQTPFKSFLIARQSIALLTIFELAESVARLSAAIILLQIADPGIDDFAKWTALLCAVPASLLAITCFWRYPETRPGPVVHFRQIAGMGLWITLSTIGWRLRTHGTQVAINSIGGAAASASYGISLQLALYQNNLSAAVYRAVRPAIVTAEGREAEGAVTKLRVTTNKLVSMLTLFFAVPMLLETETVLELWLGDAPPLTVAMTRLVVLWMSLKDLSLGTLATVHARGDVSRHEMSLASIDVLAFLAGILCVMVFGAPLWSFPLITVFSVSLQALVRVRFFGGGGAAGLREWLADSVLPYARVAMLGAIVPMLITLAMPSSPARVLLVTVASALSCGIAIYCFGLSSAEQTLLEDRIAALRRRIRRSA